MAVERRSGAAAEVVAVTDVVGVREDGIWVAVVMVDLEVRWDPTGMALVVADAAWEAVVVEEDTGMRMTMAETMGIQIKECIKAGGIPTRTSKAAVIRDITNINNNHNNR